LIGGGGLLLCDLFGIGGVSIQPGGGAFAKQRVGREYAIVVGFNEVMGF